MAELTWYVECKVSQRCEWVLWWNGCELSIIHQDNKFGFQTCGWGDGILSDKWILFEADLGYDSDSLDEDSEDYDPELAKEARQALRRLNKKIVPAALSILATYPTKQRRRK